MLAIALILVLISSPALAAMCAEKCAAGELTSAMRADNPAMAHAMSHHCEQQAEKPSKHQQNAEHQGCSMAGCHLSTSASPSSSTRFAAADFGNGVLSDFTDAAIDAEIPPPIKPPA